MLQIFQNVGVIQFLRKEKKSYDVFQNFCIQIDNDVIFYVKVK